jgi:hypothetical protein
VRGFGPPPTHPPFRPLDRPTALDELRLTGLLASPGSGPLLAVIDIGVSRHTDPTRLRFSHSAHMRRGLRTTQGGGAFGDVLKVGGLPEADRLRYAGPNAELDAPVQLSCASCHEFGPAPAHGGLAGRPDQGASPRPITYEEHCRACHPLWFDRAQPQLRVPHGIQPAEVRGRLEQTYLSLHIAGDQKLLDLYASPPHDPMRPRPGKGPDPEAVRVRDWVRDQVRGAERFLYRDRAACGRCHPQLVLTEATPPKVMRPNIPEVWLPHARFNHHTHRAVDCLACHANASPVAPGGEANLLASESASDVLIPGADTCARCHGPGARGEDGFHGVASKCTDCHNYHHRPPPVRGRPTAPEKGLSIDQFRRGHP